mgnify:CR=1 FL=1
MGEEIHSKVSKEGLLTMNIVLATTLVDMYAKCAMLKKAQEVFDDLPGRNAISWNALIAGYAQSGHGDEALKCFKQMQEEGFGPDAITFSCILKTFGSLGDIEKAQELYEEVVKKGLEKELFIISSLIEMYVRCGRLFDARSVLESLPCRNVVLWNQLIIGYGEYRIYKEVVKCVELMQQEGIKQDIVTMIWLLKTSSNMQTIQMGLESHIEVIKQGVEADVYLGSTIVDMYVKFGLISEAKEVFLMLPSRNVVAWNVLITGYAEHGLCNESMNSFERMKSDGLSPDKVTFICILKACASMEAIVKGEQIHDEIVDRCLLEKDIMLGTALVDMYAKCGILTKAQKVLDELSVRNVACWSALISGYAQLGQSEEALNCLKWMLKEGHCPNAITFLSLLNTCCHSGLVDKGQFMFDSMSKQYGITPNFEHYTCMIDLFGRAGHFDKAVTIINEMPSLDYSPVWGSLMNACQKWGNVNLARLAFEHAICLDKSTCTAYICMTNIYIAAGMQDDAQIIEVMRAENAQCVNPTRAPKRKTIER